MYNLIKIWFNIIYLGAYVNCLNYIIYMLYMESRKVSPIYTSQQSIASK